MATQTIQQQTGKSPAQAFWDGKMEAHPTLHGILAIIGEIAGFFLNGHFLVAAGRWVIRVSGYVAETALLFAVLWISGTSVAPSFVELLMSADQMQHFISVALITLALIPEIILANAIINSLSHWIAAFREKKVYLWVWAVLFTIPTLLFLGLTAITLNSLGSNGGNFVQATTNIVNWRLDAGWTYGLLEVVYIGVRKLLPQYANSVQLAVAQTPLITPTSIDYEQIAKSLLPLISDVSSQQIQGLQTQITLAHERLEQIEVVQDSVQTQNNLVEDLGESIRQTQNKLDQLLAQSLSQSSSKVIPSLGENFYKTQSETDPNLQGTLPPKSAKTFERVTGDLSAISIKSQPRITKDLGKVSGQTRKESQPKETAESASKQYAITKKEAALQRHCSIKDIEQGIDDGVIKLYANTEKVLVSSLKNFVAKRRLKLVQDRENVG